MEIRTIGILGAGQMGGGIAQVAATTGYSVVLRDISEELVRKGRAAIEKNLAKAVEKGRLGAPDRAAALGRITGTVDLGPLAKADLIVEAIIENAELKKGVFRELDAICPAHTILATNTSAISITELAAATRRPDRFIGMHFMNPVPVMKLVEIIRGIATSDATAAAVRDLATKLGKTPVECIDYPGFVSNRVLMPMINEAIFAVEQGVATPEAVDEIMRLGMNHPMGPLELADFIGLDTCLYILEVLQEGFMDPKYRPCPLLRKMVRAGRLGRKNGKGFYAWTADGKRAGPP